MPLAPLVGTTNSATTTVEPGWITLEASLASWMVLPCIRFREFLGHRQGFCRGIILYTTNSVLGYCLPAPSLRPEFAHDHTGAELIPKPIRFDGGPSLPVPKKHMP